MRNKNQLCMLACNDPVEVDKLVYPIIVQPKLDGLRFLLYPDGTLLSRTGKIIPNAELRNMAKQVSEDLACPEILDGEIYSPGRSFNELQSIVMSGSHDVPDDVLFWVFDIVNKQEPCIDRLRYTHLLAHDFIVRVPWQQVDNAQELAALCDSWSAMEGVVLRSPTGRYKLGRSTLREGLLLKLTTWVRDEARCIGLEELCNEEGIPQGRMGSLVVEHPKFGKFGIGSGFTAEQRKQLWKTYNSPLGKQVNFKYKPHGMKDVPRHPVFMGFRWEGDIV